MKPIIPPSLTTWHYRKLVVERLKESNYDEWCNSLIRAQCDNFKIPEDKVQEAVLGGKTQDETESIIVGLFDSSKGPGHESKTLISFQDSLPRLDECKRDIAEKKRVLEDVPEELKYTTGKAVKNVPSEEKTKQKILLVFAGICTVADIVNYTIFNHNTIGYSWFQSFIVPFGMLVALGYGFKLAIDVHKRRQPSWFQIIKNTMLALGISLIIAWAYLYSKYAMSIAQGPNITGMNGDVVANAHDQTSLMLWCSTIGLALVAAYGVGKVQDITDQYTDFNGVGLSEVYLQKERELKIAEDKLEWVAGRRVFTDGLLKLISDTRDSIRGEVGRLYKKHRGTG